MTVLEFFKSATKEEIAEYYVKDSARGYHMGDWLSVFDFSFFVNGQQKSCCHRECEYEEDCNDDTCLCCPYGVKGAVIKWLSTEIDQPEKGELK